MKNSPDHTIECCKKARLGIAGAGRRGLALGTVICTLGDARLQAVCDSDPDISADAVKQLGVPEQYISCEAMLDQCRLDAVILCTPASFHASQATAALKRDISVFSEAPAGTSVEECEELASACEQTKAVYMMGEDHIYRNPNLTVRELARNGLFGILYHAEGEYLYNGKELNEPAEVICGIHILGPILQWLCAGGVTTDGVATERITQVSSVNKSTVTLCRTQGGALVRIRVDLCANSPYTKTHHRLQGIDGCYESGRIHGECSRLWLRTHKDDTRELLNLESAAEKYLPEALRALQNSAPPVVRAQADYSMMRDFIDAVTGRHPPAIGIYEALDLTLPLLIGHQSKNQCGKWLPVPDSRKWSSPPKPQLLMVWPVAELGPPTVPESPEGYRLRMYRQDDLIPYVELMKSAGFTSFSPQYVKEVMRSVLPGGFFIVEHLASGDLAATTMAQHWPRDEYPFGGQVGWVAAAPSHQGRRLGRVVVSAAVRRLVTAGYHDIYLLTDDWRLPAVKTYLHLGFKPVLSDDGMVQRWSVVRKNVEM